MKRIISILIYTLCVLCLLLPLGTFLCSCFGFTFTIFSVPAFAFIVASLAVCLVVLDVVSKGAIKSKVLRALMAVVAPFSLILAVFFVVLCDHYHALVFISEMLFVGCCCFFTIKHTKPLALKIVSLILSGLMAYPIGLFSIFLLFPLGQNTVVQTVESPSGTYYAEVVDSDQGALGGDTVVNVYENWEINLLLFKIEKKPQMVYWGDWGEFQDMEVYWKDDHCIVINDTEYKIK